MTLHDSISINPSQAHGLAKTDHERLLVFMITGNPGLAEFYRPFLTNLHSLLENANRSRTDDKRVQRIHAFCPNLAGFAIDGHAARASDGNYFDLQQQIEHVEMQLYAACDTINAGASRPLKVILMGHSVGAYILLELLRRGRQAGWNGRAQSMQVVGGICLTPTVVDIAKSRKGEMFAMMFRIPHVEIVLHALVSFLTFFVPMNLLALIVRLVDGQPAHASNVVAAFLRHSVGQTLYLARDEMEKITVDRWDDEMWGVRRPDVSQDALLGSQGCPKLVFYFAKNDEWVSDETRENLMRDRGNTSQGQGSKPTMLIDTELKHGWCIDQSEAVANTVAGFVNKIFEAC